MPETVVLDGNSLSIEQICSVARNGATVAISPEARQKAQKSRDVIENSVAAGNDGCRGWADSAEQDGLIPGPRTPPRRLAS